MKKIYILIALLTLVWALSATRYAGEIFQITSGVANQAMGNTGLTNTDALSSGWWNPALLSFAPARGVELSRSEHFEGLMEQNQASLILGKNLRGSIIINHLGINNIKLTELEDPADSLSNENRPQVWKTIGNNDFIVYGAFARQISQGFSLGLAPKLAYRSLADHSGYAFGADLGLLWLADRDLSLGANLRDFFSTQVIWENGTYEVVIPNLDLEASYGFGLLKGTVPVKLSLRTQLMAEGRGEAATLSTGLISADFHGGLSITPIQQLTFLGGYDVDCLTAGLALRYKDFGLDYAFRGNAQDGIGSTQKVSLSYRW